MLLIICCLIGGPYFGGQRVIEAYENYMGKAKGADVLEEWTQKAMKQQTLMKADAQGTKEQQVAQKGGPFVDVDQSYLDDAVFIGDSRTDTLKMYAGWDNATYYVKTGTNIWDIMDVVPDDENITIEVKAEGTVTSQVLHPTSQEKIVFYLQNVPFGIQKMSGTIDGLVETSSNIGILRLDEDELFASSSVRSSVDAACGALSDKIEYLTEFLGGEYEVQGAYPAWEYRKESPLRDKMVEIFEEMYGHKPEVVAIHAGLECGLFYKKMEGLDCVSLGPDMKDIHTSEEVLSIASTERVWNYLVKVLENLKD